MKLQKLARLLCFSCAVSFAPTLTSIAAWADEASADGLAGYAGKYPFDVVGGFSFFENPKVVAAIDGAAGQGTAEWIDNLDVGTPIAFQEDGLIASVCEAHNCGTNNAALAISAKGELIALCLYSKEGELGIVPGQTRWLGLGFDRYLDPPEESAGCPRDADEFLEAYAKAIR